MGIIWIVVRAMLAGRLSPAEAFRLARNTDLGTGHRRLRASLWTLVACLGLLAAAAEAATYYASPGGSGEACTSTSPCTLNRCVQNADGPNGHTCILKNGTYNQSFPSFSGGTSVANRPTFRAENRRQASIRSGATNILDLSASEAYSLRTGIVFDGLVDGRRSAPLR